MHFKGCNHPTCNRKFLLHTGKVKPENDADTLLLATQDLCTFNIKAYANKHECQILFTGKHCNEFTPNVSLLKKDTLLKKDVESHVLAAASVKGLFI